MGLCSAGYRKNMQKLGSSIKGGFKIMTVQESFDEKKALMEDFADHKKLSRVPIVSMAQTWAIDYAGKKAADILDGSPEQEFEIYSKHLRDIYFDCVLLFGMNRPIRAYEALGYSPFFISNDGVSIQAGDYSLLPLEELDEYIADPIRYIRDIMLPRRYPNLRKPFPENMQALGECVQKLMGFVGKNGMEEEYLRNNVGVPVLAIDLVEPALDRYINYRGWKDGMLDLRRRPEKVLEALEATYPVVAPSPMPKKSFPWQFYPVVSVTYLNRKNFEKFFWPTFKRSVEAILATGGKVCVCMEGKWGHVYDMFLEFPKGSIIAFLEDDDLIETKKKIGDKVALAGGLKAQLMKDGTREENIEAVRRLLGECGNEGVMLSLNKCLLSPGDVNPDNMAAVSDFVRSYTF